MDDNFLDDLKRQEAEEAAASTGSGSVSGQAEKPNFLQRLIKRIPGLTDYTDKNERRKADQLLRDTIAARLEEARLQLSNVHQALSRDIILAMDYAESLGRIDTRLMGLIGKISDAPTGYAGYFDANAIREAELDNIYQFDAQFLDNADEIAAAVAALEAAVKESGDVDGAMTALDTAVQSANKAFGERVELLSGATNQA